jgi:hypothetical protein
MSNAGHTRPGSLRPGYTRLPDGRGRMVTMRKLSSGEQLNDNLPLDWGTLYTTAEGVTATGRKSDFAGLRLVGGQETQQTSEGWVWVRIYEDLDASAETPVGKPRVVRGPDGSIVVEQEWIQLSSAPAAKQAPGVTACPVWPVARAATGVAATDLLTMAGALELVTGDVVRFGTLTGGAGLATATDYYVIEANSTTRTFKLSLTSGGAAINFTTDITAATVLLQVSPLLTLEDARDDGAVRRILRRYGHGPELLSTPAPSLATRTTTRYVNFTLPGRLKAYTENFTVGSGDVRKMMDVYKHPPATILVLATVTISYQTSPSVGTVTPDLWNPTSWATQRAAWVGFGNKPYSQVDTYPGYRAEGGTHTDSQTAVGVGPSDVSIFGNPVYGGKTATIKVSGGPGAPGGNSYTLDVQVTPEPVYTTPDGTKYYRRTQVTATIPAEGSLPV